MQFLDSGSEGESLMVRITRNRFTDRTVRRPFRYKISWQWMVTRNRGGTRDILRSFKPTKSRPA